MPLTLSRCIRCCAIGALLLASCPETPSAAPPAALRGTVTGPGQLPLADTQVLVASRETGVSRTLQTDDQGNFGAENLPPGIDYEIQVGGNKGIFTAIVQDRVVLRSGQITREPFQLNYTVHFLVSVRGRQIPHIVNMKEVGMRTVFDHNFLQGLPITCGY
jgi:hypothetical protein